MANSKTKKLAKAKAIKNFNAYIRERDKDDRCITCGGYGTKDAGHFISCEREATRFDEKNVHGQCVECNRFKSGKQFEHGIAIDQMYGQGMAEGLLLKSRWRCSRNHFDYEAIAEEYKNKLKSLKQ